jgi:hypothetical protein
MDLGQPYQLGDVFQLPPPSRREATYANLRGEEPTKTVSTSVTPVKRVVSSAPNQPQQRIGSGGDIDSLISDYQRQRSELDDKYDKLLEVPDYSKVSQYAKERSAKGANALLLALAAQQGGEETKPIGAMYLKQASEARNPMKVASGYIDENGVYTEDPDARREIEAKRLENRVKNLDTHITGLTTKKEAMQNAKEMKQLALSVAAAGRSNNEPLVQVQQPDGTVAYMPRSQAVGLSPPTKASKEPTGEEKTAAGFLGRMEAAEKNLKGAKAFGLGQQFGLDKAPNLTNFALSSGQQVQRQQQEDWVRAKLRKESGAVIGDEEMAREIRTYFPMAGDKPAVIEQKAQSRAQAIEQMRTGAGRAHSAEAAPVTPSQPRRKWNADKGDFE